jgi:hypothetical protein
MRPFSGNVDAGEKIRAPGRARIRCARPVRSLLTASLIGRVVCVSHLYERDAEAAMVLGCRTTPSSNDLGMASGSRVKAPRDAV